MSMFGLRVGYTHPSVNLEIQPRLLQAAVLHRETYRLEVQE
jgi:hypothetical protein